MHIGHVLVSWGIKSGRTAIHVCMAMNNRVVCLKRWELRNSQICQICHSGNCFSEGFTQHHGHVSFGHPVRPMGWSHDNESSKNAPFLSHFTIQFYQHQPRQKIVLFASAPAFKGPFFC